MSNLEFRQQLFPFMPPQPDWLAKMKEAAEKSDGWVPLSLVARYFGVSHQTARNWALHGTHPKREALNVVLPTKQIGRCLNAKFGHIMAFEAARLDR